MPTQLLAPPGTADVVEATMEVQHPNDGCEDCLLLLSLSSTNGGKVTDRCVARFVAPSPEADSMSPMIMSAEPPSPEPVSPATPTSMSPLKGAGGEP